MNCTITGIRPLLMHNGRLADPLDAMTIRLKETHAKNKGKNKSDKLEREIADLEFLGSLYWCEDLGVYMPADNIEACFVAGAKKARLGKNAIAGLQVDVEFGVAIRSAAIKKSETPEALVEREDLRFRKGVRVTTSKIMRTRPIIPTGWQLDVPIAYEPDLLNKAQVRQLVEDAGLFVGLGDWRPRFGRFTVEWK